MLTKTLCKLFTLQVPAPVVQSTPVIVPSYAPVVAQPVPRPQQQQQQRPVSIHSFSSLQSQAPSKPLSPLPLLQTASPQFQSPSASPRGWSHVIPPRSPGAVAKQPLYNTAPIASPFESNSTSSFGQPQVQSHRKKDMNIFFYFPIGWARLTVEITEAFGLFCGLIFWKGFF